MLDEKMFEVWKDAWKYHKENQSKFHKHVQSSDDIGVNIYGWHCGIFGIGLVAKKLYHSAKRAGLPASAIEAPTIAGPTFKSPAEIGIDLTRSLNEAVNIVSMNAPETEVFFVNHVSPHIRLKKYNIGYWNWELDVFPASWMTFLKYFDEVWVPSRFNALALKASPGFDDTIVQVVPIPQDTGYDKTIGDKVVDNKEETLAKFSLDLRKKLRGNASNPFVFLVVFDFGSSIQRKNPTASIRAFIDAFPRSEDPNGEKYQLVVKT